MRSGKRYFSFIGAILLIISLLIVPTNSYAKDRTVEEGSSETLLEVQAYNVESYNITNTKEGQSAAKEAISRWETEGVGISIDQVQVYNFGTAKVPDILVMPSDLEFQSTTSSREQVASKVSELNSETAITIKAEALEKAVAETATPDAVNASWRMIYNRCLSRKVRTVTINWQNAELGWMDTCYKVHKIDSDGNAWRDYWQLEVYATARSTHPFVLTQANIQAQRASTSTAMRWVDWSPRSDLDKGGCTAVPVGISAVGLSITSVFSVCDKWDITKYAEDGKFRTSWVGSSWFAWWNIEAEREVAFMQAIWVVEGKTPVWNVYQNFKAATSGSEY